jgi:hypothetical protein
MVQILLGEGAVAVQVLSEPVNYHGTGFLLGHRRSVAIQFVSESEICHDAGFKLPAYARTLSGAKGGCKNHYKFVLGVGAKAKTVTSNLPILSVL